MIASATTHRLWQTQLFAKHNGEKMATVKRCILLGGGHLSNHKNENIDLAQRIGPWQPNSRKYESRYKPFTLTLGNSHYNSSLGWQFLDYFWLSDLFLLSKFHSLFAAPNLSHSNLVFLLWTKSKVWKSSFRRGYVLDYFLIVHSGFLESTQVAWQPHTNDKTAGS